jgi:hypothetical protein
MAGGAPLVSRPAAELSVRGDTASVPAGADVPSDGMPSWLVAAPFCPGLPAFWSFRSLHPASNAALSRAAVIDCSFIV